MVAKDKQSLIILFIGQIVTGSQNGVFIEHDLDTTAFVELAIYPGIQTSTGCATLCARNTNCSAIR